MDMTEAKNRFSQNCKKRLKTGRIVAEDCKITVGPFNMYNGKVNILICKIKLLNVYIYILESRLFVNKKVNVSDGQYAFVYEINPVTPG